MYAHNGFGAEYPPSTRPTDSTHPLTDRSQYASSSINVNQINYAPALIPFQQHDDSASTKQEFSEYSLTHVQQSWYTPNAQPIDATPFLAAHHDQTSLTNWPNFPSNNKESSDSGDVSESRSPLGDQGEDRRKERKERRRAQNRVAQRLFRARREVSLKESSARLGNLEDEVVRLQSTNEDLSETVTKLRDEISRLQRENMSLKQTTPKSIEVNRYHQPAAEIPIIFVTDSEETIAMDTIREDEQPVRWDSETPAQERDQAGHWHRTREKRDRRKTTQVMITEVLSNTR